MKKLITTALAIGVGSLAIGLTAFSASAESVGKTKSCGTSDAYPGGGCGYHCICARAKGGSYETFKEATDKCGGACAPYGGLACIRKVYPTAEAYAEHVRAVLAGTAKPDTALPYIVPPAKASK
jgi:hypothetical protein